MLLVMGFYSVERLLFLIWNFHGFRDKLVWSHGRKSKVPSLIAQLEQYINTSQWFLGLAEAGLFPGMAVLIELFDASKLTFLQV